MYVQGKIETCPYNESSWNYLRGLLSLPGTDKALVLEDLAEFCLKVGITVLSCLLWLLLCVCAALLSMTSVV